MRKSHQEQAHRPRTVGANPRALFPVALLALLLTVAAEGAESAEDVPENREPYGLFRLPEPGEAPTEHRILAPNEPIYFVVGGSNDTTARFQLSFQYRLFDRGSSLVRWLPWAYGLHFGYTQTSLWNLSEDSKPFEDTSYRPSLFWQGIDRVDGLRPDGLRFGYEHESNGQGEEQSRSIDTLFVHPGWFFTLGRRELLVAPKLYLYLAKGNNNPDIADYRGFAEMLLRYGRADSWQVAARVRAGEHGYRSAQIDFSYPLRDPIAVFARTGGFFYVQLFHGYGESLLSYNRREDLQIRVGLAIVR